MHVLVYATEWHFKSVTYIPKKQLKSNCSTMFYFCIWIIKLFCKLKKNPLTNYLVICLPFTELDPFL